MKTYTISVGSIQAGHQARLNQLALSIMLAFCFSSIPSNARGDDVAFFYALEADMLALKRQALVTRQPIRIGTRSIHVVSLAKHRVYAVKMGSGAVETAISAEGLLSRFRCDFAISLGPIGALSDRLKVNDWYKVVSLVAYQKGAWTGLGFQLHKDAKIALADSFDEGRRPPLLEKLKEITVASGETFVASASRRQQLHEESGADAVDMNLFGLVKVCQNHGVPLVSWRIVSDRADDNAGADFHKFTQNYDGAGGKAVTEIIKTLPANPNSPQSYSEIEKLLKPNKEQKQN